jgi:hypothetical protein
MSRERIEEIEPAELPKAQSAERCSRVRILIASILLQMRYRDREGCKTVVLKGKASRAKQFGCRAQRPCKLGGYVVELPLDVPERAKSFVDLGCRHETPSARQAPSDLQE